MNLLLNLQTLITASGSTFVDSSGGGSSGDSIIFEGDQSGKVQKEGDQSGNVQPE